MRSAFFGFRVDNVLICPHAHIETFQYPAEVVDGFVHEGVFYYFSVE